MRIAALTVANFRGIELAELSDLDDMVMIAGPNGCGKSCVLDAIRLLKSSYGGYQPNEWQQWFGEFQINLQQDPEQLQSLLRSRDKELVAAADFQLSDREVAYLRENGQSLIEDLMWKAVVPGLNDPWIRSRASIASELRAHKPEVDRRTQKAMPVFWDQILRPTQRAEICVTPKGVARTTENMVLEVVFGSYKPGSLGVVDYHGAHRNYARERFGGINLNIEESEQNLRKHALYSYANKYSNIKSELAAAYVRSLLSEKAGGPSGGRMSLNETLKELFTTFFPGKEFLGPVPTRRGGLDFPVRLTNGLTHDINELSSGEKEVLFGYLRLSNTAPCDSVILLDEPELHLNPALVRGLPQFYQAHLGKELGNQIWLVTHSDAFLREAVGAPGFSVSHMRDAATEAGLGNQMHLITAERELESAVIDLVGDLAAYKPGATVVLLEGEDSEFDRSMVTRLFPTFEQSVNLVSAGNRTRVRRLHELLDAASERGGLPSRFFSIVDRDTESGETSDGSRRFKWDVYHIENYLLEPDYIFRILQKLDKTGPGAGSPEEVEAALKAVAESTLNTLVCHRLQEIVGRHLVGALGLRVSPVAEDTVAEVQRAVTASISNVNALENGELAKDRLREQEDELRTSLKRALDSGSWRAEFRGRDVLRRFAGEYVDGMRYEYFRDLLIAEMKDSGFEPVGMRKVVVAILDQSRAS